MLISRVQTYGTCVPMKHLSEAKYGLKRAQKRSINANYLEQFCRMVISIREVQIKSLEARRNGIYEI